jgi:hypothetical protein
MPAIPPIPPRRPATPPPEDDTLFTPQQQVLKTEPLGGAGGSFELPFQIYDVSPDSETPTVRVRYGTVMDIEPTGVETDIEITPDTSLSLYLECTIDDDGVVTAVTLETTTGSVPSSDTYVAILLVGIATADTDPNQLSISQSLYFSQGFSTCNRDPEDPATEPGTYEFFVR